MIRGASSHAHMHHGHAANPIAAWMVMTVAMMVPMVAGSIRVTAQRSFWRRRHRAAAGFLLGYLSCWLIAGVAVSYLPVRAGARAAAIAFFIAAVWQLTRWKRRSLAACHRTMPLAPNGWRADRDCIRFGWRAALPCFASCWALMLACLLSGHALFAAAAATAAGLAERSAVRDPRLLAVALLTVSLFYGVQ